MLLKRPLGKTGYEVTELGFGALEIGRDWAADVNADPSHLTYQEAETVLNGLLDRGINFIDTAPAYWYSEEFIGRALAHRRDEYVLATKVGEHCDPSGSVYDYSAKATAEFIERSLKLLRTDHIDLIQIHSASMEVLERGETLEALESARQAGKVLHIGMTGGVPEAIRALELGGYETVQFPYNLLHPEAEDRLLPLAQEKKAGVILMRPLCGGKLTAKYKHLENPEVRETVRGFLDVADARPDELASLALRFVLSNPAVTTAIAGTRRLEAIDENIEALQTPLSRETRLALLEYSRANPVSAW